MNIHLVRHGESTWNSENKIQGHSDVPLSSVGFQQAKLLAKSLAREKFSCLYSSKLIRARQTAEIVSKSIGIPISYQNEIKEIFLGEWEGKTPEEVNKEYNNGYDRWRENPTKTIIPGAEPITAFKKRSKKAFEKIIKNHSSDDNILIITHGGFITSIISHVLEVNFDRLITRLPILNTGITKITKHDDKMYIYGINDVSHMV